MRAANRVPSDIEIQVFSISRNFCGPMPFVAAAEEQRSLAAIVKTAFSAKATSAEQDPGATVAPTLPALGSVGSLEAAVVASATAPPTPAPKHKGMRL